MKIRVLTTAAAALLVLAGCSDSTGAGDTSPTPDQATTESADPSESASASAEPTEESTPEPADPEYFTVMSGGDILLHLSVNESARIQGETYDYLPLYEGIQPFIDDADVAICALEVPIVGQDQMPSNYPNFGAPWDLAQSLADIGYDGCAVATNHTMDRGFGGVDTTIQALTDAGLGWAGSARTEGEADEIQFYNIEGEEQSVSIAHISATTLTNGIPIPADHPYSWNVVGDLGQPVDTIIDDAKKARKRGADIVVVSMHWGTEYVNDPIPEQIDIAQQLAESGEVDLVFGNHSHVPQPLDVIPGGPNGEGMWVVYSMGNQISGQTVQNHGPRVTTGLITTATIEVRGENDASITDFDFTVVTQDRAAGERLRLLTPLMNGEYPEGLALSQYDINSRADATYPVMSGSGEERTEAPEDTGATLTITRE